METQEEVIYPADLMPLLDKLLTYLTNEQLEDYNKWLKETN